MATNIDKFIEPAELGAGIAIPVGGCFPWMSPVLGSPEPAPPTGFEYCDGGNVVTAGSSLLGRAKPALMATVANPGTAKTFVRGGDTTVAYGGVTSFVSGGSDTHTHTGTNANAGAHDHDMQNHTHAMQSHTHSVNIVSTNDINRTVFSPGATHRTDGLNGDENHQHSLIGTTGTPSVSDTGAPSNNTTTSAGDHTHVLTVDSASGLPAFVELAWLIRVL